MTAKEALHMASVILDGLGMLERLTHVGGDKAVAALAAVRAGLAALQEGAAGKTDAQIVLAQIEALHSSLAGNDAAADALVRETP